MDEADLLAALEAAGGEVPVCTCTDKCVVGSIHTDCPVCSVNMGECAGTAPEPAPTVEPEPDPEPEQSGSGIGGTLLLVLAVIGIGGGAGWYFKIFRPKKEQAADAAEDEYEEYDDMSQYIRSYIQTFRKSFSLISPYPLIESSANGYYINHDFHIMTDLQQFDMLWEQALHAVTIPHKVELLKQAVELYKGPVFENACTEHWILSTVNHYQLRYIGLVNELLATLDEAGDYTGVQQYAARAIQLTPENINAHYWLIHSMNHLGTLEMAKNAVSHAKVVLTGEEFNKLKKDVAQDKTMPYSVLFADE